MKNLMDIEGHHFRTSYKTWHGVKFEIFKDDFWCGYDLRQKPYSFCIRDMRRQLILYAVRKHQFTTRQDAENFIDKIIVNNEIEKLEEELILHKDNMQELLTDKCTRETFACRKEFMDARITIKKFFSLVNTFNSLPAYLKRFLERLDV